MNQDTRETISVRRCGNSRTWVITRTQILKFQPGLTSGIGRVELGEIVTAFCEARFRIEFLHEFPQFFYGGYTDIQIQENKTESYPRTFSLKALAV